MALIEEDLILLDTQATDRNDALSQVAEHLHKDGFVKASYREAIINREANFPTGLQTATIGVAIPHTDAEHVNTAKIAVARLQQPVTFEQMGDGQPVAVEMIFMLALKEPHAQLTMLQNLMTMFQNTEVMNQLIHAQTPTAVLVILNENNIK